MAKKLIEWFFLNVLFALLPLILAMGFRWANGSPILSAPENIPELAFVSVMLNIVTVGDLGEVAKTPAWEAVFRLAYYLLLFFAVISVAVLAAYLNETIIGPVNGGVMTHLLFAAWIVAWVSLVISSLSEVLLNVIAAKPAKGSGKTP